MAERSDDSVRWWRPRSDVEPKLDKQNEVSNLVFAFAQYLQFVKQKVKRLGNCEERWWEVKWEGEGISVIKRRSVSYIGYVCPSHGNSRLRHFDFDRQPFTVK